MAFKDYSKIVLETRKNKKNSGNSNISSSSGIKDYSPVIKKQKLGKVINFDTFESDLKSLGTTVQSIYDGWQTEETMKNTRSSIESMHTRLNAYQEYQKMFGGADLTEVSNSYKTILEGWDDRTKLYGQYKDANSYTTEQTKLGELNAMKMEDIEPYLKDNKNPIAYTTIGGQDITWQSLYEDKKHNKMSTSEEGKIGYDKYLEEEKKAQEKAKANQPSAFEESIIRGFITSSDNPMGTVINNVIYDKGKDDSYKKPTEDWTDAERNIFGAYYLENPKSAYDYAIQLNNQKAKEKKNEGKSTISENATSNFGSGLLNWGGAVLTSSFGLADYLDDLTDIAAGREAIVEEGIVTPFEYSQTVKGSQTELLNEKSGTLNENIPIIGGKGLGDAYGLGTSIIESRLMGGLSKLAGNSAPTLISFFGQGAAASIDDALSRGVSKEQALLYGSTVGALEGLSEMIGTEKLLKIGDSETFKQLLVNALIKQPIAEGLEEGFSAVGEKVADDFINRDKSNFNNLVRQLQSKGLSEDKAKSKAWVESFEEVAFDTIAGMFSGLTHGGMELPIGAYNINVKDKSIGQNIRNNERVGEMLDTASLTPEESDTYKLYTDYAKKGMNSESASDLQLGRLYTQANVDARETISSRKTSLEQKGKAFKTLEDLSVVDTENTVVKRAKELATGNETKITSSGNSATIEGIKFGEDTTIVTNEGEILVDEMTLAQRDAELVAYAEQMNEEDANLFIAQDDGKTEVSRYADSFNLVMLYAKNNYTEDTILKNKGVLSTEQVNAIYSATVVNQYKAKQNAIDTLNAKWGKNMTYKGVVDDSVIDYNNTNAKGKVNWNSLNSSQKQSITFMTGIAKATGMNLKLIPNGLELGINGAFEVRDNTIVLDIYAGMNKLEGADFSDTIIPTASHEMTHWMKDKSPELYHKIDRYIFETLMMDGSTEEQILAKRRLMMERNHPDTKFTDDEVRDEVIARACEDMLSMSEEGKKIFESLSENEKKTFVDKIKDIIQNLKDWIGELLSKYKSNSPEAKAMRQYEDRLNQLSKMWDEMLVASIQTNQNLKKEGIIAEELVNGISKDGTTIVGKNNIQMSERTYAEGGRDFLANWLDEQKGLSQEDKKSILEQTDAIASLMKDIRENNELPDYARWAAMDVVKDENGEKVLSVIVKNGDYAMNIDFSQVCKKRVALNAVLNAMVQSGDLNAYTLTETDVADLNAIIKEHEFEIACALCFVDSKRYRVGSWAESFCEGTDKKKNGKMVHQYGFNEMVRSLIPKGSKIQIDEFNFTNREIIGQPTSNLLSEMDDSELDFTLIDEILEREFKAGSKPTDLYAYAKAIKDNKELRKILNPAEIISSIGLDAIRLDSPELYRLINRHQGTAKPKFAHDVVAYTNDILKASNFTKEKAKMVGGVRCQSFSDFMANMVFDYVQFISELSAKELTAHSYTKEPLFVRLFGLTGMKINMSLVPKAVQMTPEQQEYFAILNDKNANKRSAEYKKAKRDYQKLTENAGLDENGNYIWEDETFPYDIAMELVVDPRYSANCGTIAVGISDNHILKLLNDDNISMVIPYHKSGLNHIVAMMRNIDLYNDYTTTQNTRFANGKKLEKVPDFDFYGDLYGTDGKEGTHNPKKTAENYLKWCDEHNYIPKFEKSRIGRKFRDNPNYYKLLIDFRVYDTDGTYREQQAVKPIYPENEEFKDLILNGVKDKNGKVYGGLKQQQNTSDKLDAESQQIVNEFRNRLKEKYGKDVLAKKNSDRDLAPTFYSQMGKTINEMKQDKIGASSVVSYLKGRGIKNEEIKWSGIETFLEGKKSVTKAELQEFVAGSMLQIEVNEEIANDVELIAMRNGDYQIRFNDDYDSAITLHKEDEIWVDDHLETEWVSPEEAYEHYNRPYGSKTRWHEYKLNGGANYRELLFTMPNSSYSNQAMKTHWGQDAEGILAHARIQDFDVNGKKMLFIEELQSDWHNTGKKYGYKDNTFEDKSQMEYASQKVISVYGEDLWRSFDDGSLARVGSTRLLNEITRLYEEAATEWKMKNESPPDAPFKDNYHEFVLKRLLRMAAEQGYDSIGWTPADIQSERWSDEYAEGYRIEYDQDMPKFLNKYGKKWGAKVGSTILDSGTEVWSMDITDSMKESVLYEGQVMYSDRDSEGNTLTNEQIEYFKDSKIRDKNGNLLVCYHGTDADFNTFDYNFISQDNKLGFGFYFMAGKKLQYSYKNPLKTYLNITNPLTDTSKKFSKEALSEFCENLGIKFDYDSADYDLDVYERLSYSYTGKTENFLKAVIDILGVDGIISENRSVAVAFSPKQIKETTNKTPTTNPDIRYADREYPNIDKRRNVRDNESRANKQGDFINEFYPALSGPEWKKFYDGIATEGYLGETMIGITAPIVVGDKLVIAKRLYTEKDVHDYVVKDVFRFQEIYDGDLLDSIKKAIQGGNLIYDRQTMYQNLSRFLARNQSTGILARFDADSQQYVIGDSKGINGNGNERIHRDSQEGIAGEEISLRNQSGVRQTDGVLTSRLEGGRKQNSDRDNVSVYDQMGETDRLIKENEKLKEDITRLKGIIGNEEIPIRRFRSLADYLKKQTGSNVSREALGDMLNDAYTFIQDTDNIQWGDVVSKTYDIANYLINRNLSVSVNYFKEVMSKIRKDTVSLTEEQKNKAGDMFGGYSNFHKSMFGRINITTEGKPLSEMWQEWSKAYPEIFKADVKAENQIEELVNIVDTLKETSSLMGEFEREEAIRHLSVEIYNQFWNIASDSSDIAKDVKAQHRKMMEEMRKGYEERQLEKTLHPVGETALKYEAFFNKVARTHKNEIANIKKRSAERMDAYKENAERKTKIQSITSNALTLNRWLVKNSKDEHIHEAMKEPVAKLLNAIDFSSRRKLEKGEPTQKDVSFAKAFAEIEKMLIKANNGEDGLIELYGHDLGEGIKMLVDAADRLVGDNNYVINKMTLEELNHLDRLVKYIKKVVTDLNKFHTVNHAKGIANMSQESMEYLDKLGKAKIYDGLRGAARKLVNWGNSLPYYVFKRYGEGGTKVFEAFQDGWDKFAFHIKEIIDYANKTYSSKEVKEWGNEIKEFKILIPPTDIEKSDPNYKPKHQTVQMSVSQIMSMYCLVKREQARNHMIQGGIRIADIKREKGEIISQSDGVVLTYTDVVNIISSLSVRQKAVADKLQEFMNTTCTDWGNEVSMLRFGIKSFGEENYFPIQSDSNNLAVNDETEKSNSLFRLLNMSFTKSTVENANNRIVISDIFDVFAQHTSDMAKYNALALPVLDAFKWYNYNEKIEKGDGTFITKGVKQSIETAFGKDGQNYFTTFLKDLNGEKEVSRDTLGRHFFSNAKIAAVGMNLRVVALQPTSYLRASAVIDNKYLTKALFHKPKTSKAETYCGMALWKSMGYYDTNVQKGVEEQIKHNTTIKDKFVEFSMKGAEIADELTWGYLWNACELEVRDKRKDLKVGSDEFYKEIGKRLREVIYATQVVDSTMTRSQMMRSNGLYDKMLTAFASEPTLAYNMLQDAYMGLQLDARQMGKKEAFKKNGKKIARVVTAYTVTNIIAALVESGFDAFRDDEEEEMDSEEFMKMFFSNLASDMSITAKIPIVKELHSFVKGFGSSRSDTQWMDGFVNALKGWYKVFNGEGNPEKVIKKSLKSISEFFGIPVYNAYRDFMATLNKLDILTTEDLEEMFEGFFE